ncbi:isoleucine--tRNA ligase [Sphingomonas sp. 28-63-12]|uniref:isoleucine--tRNA ligase n=1 Tax=Sphingomonas sp. 28-63-12 TaxID=1970434 RepID=UPI000BC735EA|nr:MAG: isoleucine--tRNA ligase [Sphingomonas sp. 28-63-12]
MTDTTAPDYKDTVFLPKTAFPMKAGLPQKEPGILAHWQSIGLYEKLREARRGREKFILHDGPPYANGDMHIGHALNHILKDTVCRTQSLLGKDAPYVPGWDCHGLPIEWKVEEQYRAKKRNKDEVPAAEFRAECRAYAQHWVNTQREQLKRLGINGDWDHPYLTMDFQAEATIVTELMKFAEGGQLYRGAKPVMWSPVEKTALAEAEVEYEDIVSTQIDVAFEIVDSKIDWLDLTGKHHARYAAIIWTTTPWTIPVNQALAYGRDIRYAAVGFACNIQGPDDQLSAARGIIHEPDIGWIVAESLVDATFKRYQRQLEARVLAVAPDATFDWTGPTIEATFDGALLEGATARHPMANFFKPLPSRGGVGGGASSIGAALGDGAVSPTASFIAGDAPADSPHPNPSPEGEGLSVDVNSPLAEFFLRPRPFLPGDFVTTDAGTGLVHMAPDHGEDDFLLCKAHGIEPVFAVDAAGMYRADWAWLGGQGSVINKKFVSADGPICSDLRASGGLLAASDDFKHSYPHSWRSKAKVIFRCTPQWFVPMDLSLSQREREGAAKPRTGEGDIAGVAHAPSPRGALQLAPLPMGEGEEGDTLRNRALAAIEATRWVPAKGQNRITAMVSGRPDWVLSRQRAWGVPITLFVDRRSGQYLCDPAVNARIIAAISAQGVDAWTDEAAPALLGPAYDAADYERVADILDVWFDSGCTHAFVLESGKWPDLLRPAGYQGPPADLYLEGSDQHRGWFQSSLLESCGTRGHAPYKAVLTHGFTMDQKGMKMSKSLGNTINPIDLMKDSGADILRLWALTVDFTEDHRIGKEILNGVSDQYRKLRNTFRYLLGALEGFDEAERLPVKDMPELERYVLFLLADMDAKLKTAVNDYDFNSYVRLLSDFANEDLSAFYFDIRKDCLYCEAPTSTKRRAARTVMDTLFHALVRYAAPVLAFTAEEIWQTRFPSEDGSVHLLEWPELPPQPGDSMLGTNWADVRSLRVQVTEAIEPLRREKIVRSSLEAEVTVPSLPLPVAALAEVFIVAKVTKGDSVSVLRTDFAKCGRCWRHLPEVVQDGALCDRCAEVVT